MSAALCVVLDTHVVLSALVSGGGLAGRLRVGWRQGVFVPMASTATAQELVRVLAYPKFRLSKLEQDELLADYLPHIETVRIPQLPPSVPNSRDLLVVPFLHLAVAGRADVMLSGDRDLLALAGEFNKTCACPIMSLDTFVRAYLAG